MTEAKPRCGSRLGFFASAFPDFLSDILGDFGAPVALTFHPAIPSAYPESCSVGMKVVLATRDPLKVVNEVVGLDSVLVVHLKSVVTRDECFGDKAMDGVSLPSSLVAQDVVHVSTPSGQGLQDPPHPKPLTPAPRQKPAAPAKGANFVDNFPCGNRLPFFSYHNTTVLHTVLSIN